MNQERTLRRESARRTMLPGMFPWVVAGCVMLVLLVRSSSAALADPSAVIDPPDSTIAQATALKQEQYAIADQLNKDFPQDFEALRILGFVHSSHGNLEQMFQCWRECCRLEPDRADVYDQLGRHAADLEQYEEAIGYWRKALSIKADLPDAAVGIGSALLNLGRLDEAITALQHASRLVPQSDEAHYLLAEAFFQPGINGFPAGLNPFGAGLLEFIYGPVKDSDKGLQIQGFLLES